MGYYDPDEMLEGKDPKLLYEWQAISELEPFGDEREDIRMAMICLTIATSAGMKKRGGGAYKLTDFIPKFDQDIEESKSLDPMSAQAMMKKRYGNNSKSGS